MSSSGVFKEKREQHYGTAGAQWSFKRELGCLKGCLELQCLSHPLTLPRLVTFVRDVILSHRIPSPVSRCVEVELVVLVKTDVTVHIGYTWIRVFEQTHGCKNLRRNNNNNNNRLFLRPMPGDVLGSYVILLLHNVTYFG